MLILSSMILSVIGIYFLLEQVNKVIGYIILGQAINLFLLSININNTLLAQSLILTSIVISLSMIALFIKK